MSKVALLALSLVVTACASSPVGVTRVDPSTVHQRLTRNALSTKQLSSETRNVLLEANLDALFDDNPEKALEHLHDPGGFRLRRPGAAFRGGRGVIPARRAHG